MSFFRRLALSAARQSPSTSSLTSATFRLSRVSRPRNLTELRRFECLLQRRWNSDLYPHESPLLSSEVEGENAGARADSSGAAGEPTAMLYVGNLPWTVTEDELNQFFSKYGAVQGSRVVTYKDGTSRGFGFVEFHNEEDAQKAIQNEHNQPFGNSGRNIIVQFGVRRTVSYAPRDPSKTLFLGNLSYQMTDQDIMTLFKDIKNCVDVRIAMDRTTGQPRGFAHADFRDVASAQAARELLHGRVYYGRAIRANYAMSKDDHARNLDVGGQANVRKMDGSSVEGTTIGQTAAIQ